MKNTNDDNLNNVIFELKNDISNLTSKVNQINIENKTLQDSLITLQRTNENLQSQKKELLEKNKIIINHLGLLPLKNEDTNINKVMESGVIHSIYRFFEIVFDLLYKLIGFIIKSRKVLIAIFLLLVLGLFFVAITENIYYLQIVNYFNSLSASTKRWLDYLIIIFFISLFFCIWIKLHSIDNKFVKDKYTRHLPSKFKSFLKFIKNIIKFVGMSIYITIITYYFIKTIEEICKVIITYFNLLDNFDITNSASIRELFFVIFVSFLIGLYPLYILIKNFLVSYHPKWNLFTFPEFIGISNIILLIFIIGIILTTHIKEKIEQEIFTQKIDSISVSHAINYVNAKFLGPLLGYVCGISCIVMFFAEYIVNKRYTEKYKEIF